MPSPTEQGSLFATDQSSSFQPIAINGRCTLRRRDGHCAVTVGGVLVAHFAQGDRAAEALAMIQLVDLGHADQAQVARAFGCSTRTVRRVQRRLETDGIGAVGRGPGYPKGVPRLPESRVARVSRLKADGLSNRAIAARIGVTEKAVRKLLARLGWKPRAPDQLTFAGAAGADPNVSAPSPARPPIANPQAEQPIVAADPNVSAPSPEPTPAAPPIAIPQAQALMAAADPNVSGADSVPIVPTSIDHDPSDRRGDRLLASLGLLDDAAPLFRAGTAVPRVGVLLAIPALVESGALDCAREIYGSIGPAFFGLRTTIVTMVLLALLRIKRPEGLKEHSPADLGRLIGLDRAPEVKTLRGKLARLAADGRAEEFGHALARRRVASHSAALGFLYVDGHVRAYHGAREIPKTHVARVRLSMPATTDYWVNDSRGEPVFVLTAQANAGLVEMLPPVLREVRALVGDRRVTIVFDRGGWSPALFARIIGDGFDVLTYRKQPYRKVPRRRFAERKAKFDGREVTYRLADQRVRLKKCKPLLRQVTRLTDTGHQTAIITSRTDLPDVDVAFRMFERWRQENFFKYLREEYALDALADHAAEPDDPDRSVPNPKRVALDAEIKAAKAVLMTHVARCGLGASPFEELLAIAADKSDRRRAPALGECFTALNRYARLLRRQPSVPTRVPVRDVTEGSVVKLATERKHLTNVLKMTAFQLETALVDLVAPHYKRADEEARTLVQTALASAGDLAITDTELRVTLAPLSSPHRSRAIAVVCDALNRSNTKFPGSALTLRFAVAQPAAM